MNEYDKIYQEINKSVYDGAYKLQDIHFRISSNLHSNTYYYVERFLQDKSKCESLCNFFIKKLKANNHDSNITFIGYLNYTGLCLNYITSKLSNINYGIIENGEEGFSWQFIPKPKDKIIIVLPISCTFATYFKLKKWIHSRGEAYGKKVITTFYNLFTVFDTDLKALGNSTLQLNNFDHAYKEASNLYKNYNWSEINTEGVIIGDLSNSTNYSSNVLIRLYSKLQIAESCQYCYPKENWFENAQPLILSHPYLDFPNQIFSLPFFDANENSNSSNIFEGNDFLNKYQVYVNLSARESQYLSYIRGNEFYKENRDDILDYFKEIFKKVLDSNIKKIVFITSDGGKSSNFLEDFSLDKDFQYINIQILRFNPSYESIETFMNLNKERIYSNSSLIIFYEDVIAGAKTFKLLSDYIKHYRLTDRNETVINRHGFDFIWTLIDRSNYFIKSEIIKKINSPIIENPESRFIIYRNLNVPILSSFHIENPLNKKLNDLKKILRNSHLDYVSLRIIEEIKKNQFIKLPEINKEYSNEEQIKYFPFGSIENKYDEKLIKIYEPYFHKANHSLLRLYLSDRVSSHLSDFFSENLSPKNESRFSLIDLIKIIDQESKEIAENFLVSKEHNMSNERKLNIEKDIIRDSLIKLLSRQPFQYYKGIKDEIFSYCLRELEKIHLDLPDNSIKSFNVFRNLKFYVKRNVDLGSNYILSKTFFLSIKDYYNYDNESRLLKLYSKTKIKLDEDLKNGKISFDYHLKSINNIEYKRNQLVTYFDFLLTCYKDLIHQEPSRTLYLEKIINDEDVLPNGLIFKEEEDYDMPKLVNLIMNPYFHFTGAVKAENLNFIHDLISLHLNKGNYKEGERKKVFPYYKKYYFNQQNKKDPAIINIRKFVANSRFNLLKRESNDKDKINEIIDAYAQMVILIDKLKSSKVDYNSTKKFNDALSGLLIDIKLIFSSKKDNDLQVGLFYDYGELESHHNKAQIYYCLSSSENFWLESTILDEKGFVLKFIKGLYTESSKGRLQSFIAGIKTHKKWIAFEENYFDVNDEKHTIDELLNNDMLTERNESYPYLLNDSSMFMAIKLTDLLDEDIAANYEHKGKAVLMFTTKSKLSFKNFLDFFSNEKFRLILAIKKYILEYLQKQFNNTAFIEVIQNKSKVRYQKVLRHQLGTYYNNLDLLYSSENSDNNKLEFNITLNAIRSQVAAYDSKYILGEGLKTRKEIDILIKTVFRSKCLGKREFRHYYIYNKVNEFIIPDIVYNVIIPQLLINIKQYTENIPSQIEIYIISDVNSINFLFKNKIAHHKVLNTKNVSKKEGRIMCEKIIDNYNEFLRTNNNVHEIKEIKFSYPKENFKHLEYYETSIKIIFND
ncbi:hypothetical protein [Kordia sp.]|uniref:hypothetical protein n=1 Tax=Kordia sp. TaxID=1965332 RepID=UPI003D2BC85C